MVFTFCNKFEGNVFCFFVDPGWVIPKYFHTKIKIFTYITYSISHTSLKFSFFSFHSCHKVRKVTRSCLSPSSDDELELVEGDYVLADPHELNGSKNGWCKGISTVTGNIGMFRISCTIRASETSTWTLHK